MGATASRIGIPEAMKLEHAALHEELVQATREAGAVGEAARAVAKVLHPHFVREEEIALPPLGLLEDLAGGVVTPEMAEVLPMTDALEAELPAMLREHRTIASALENLREVARRSGDRDAEQLAEKILVHARMEEQVTYPASLLVGRTVRAALAR